MGRQSSKDKYKLSAVDSIERLPLSEQVYLTLKTAILTGELMPQEKLNEVKIAEQLQVSATPEQVQELRTLCKEMHEIEDATERVDVNSRFHTMIAHYSGNERIVDYLAGFRERVNRDMYISSFNAVRTHDCDDEHDQIVDAIERHDEVAAETAMRQHINNAFIFKKANAEVQHKKLNEV